MSNFTISNNQASLITLEPLRDIGGHPLVLRPKGTKEDAKEIDEATANSEIVARMTKAKWVSVKPISVQAQAIPPAPPAPKPAPKAPTPVVKIPEPVEPPAPEAPPVAPPAAPAASDAPPDEKTDRKKK